MSAPEIEVKDESGASADAALWRRFAGVPGDDLKAGAVHRIRIGGSASDRFLHYPVAILPPDRRRGEALMQDRWRIGHDRLQLETGGIPWRVAAPSRHFADRLHRFDWLAALFAEGEEGANRARSMVDDWIAEFGKFQGFYWRTVPTAARVWNWMLAGPALFEIGEESDLKKRMDALARQLRHLEASFDDTVDPVARWQSACVLLLASVALDGGQGIEPALHRLDQECTAQILPDGGLVCRSPERLIEALSDLLVLKDLFQRAGHPAPDFVSKWIGRMAAMVQFFQMGDGALAVFNDGGESRPECVEAVLAQLETAPRDFSFAMKSGFQKLSKADLTLILDAGTAPPRPYAGRAHAGVLGFEFSDGPARMITSCGFSSEVSLDWQAAVRRTAAHSTLILSGRDSADFESFESTRLLVPIGPEGVSAKRLEEADEIWLDAQHGAWKSRFGMIHRRRLFMSGDGARLTGEDSLVRPVSLSLDDEGRFLSFDIRFHLHPSVQAEMDKDAIRLVSELGTVWRFRTTHPGTKLETSRYLGRGLVEQTQQIVMSGRADPNGDGAEPPNCIRWGFRRESRGR
ncbi:MAG: heparinase II/III family protein [Pseudomonadota bacterium]